MKLLRNFLIIALLLVPMSSWGFSGASTSKQFLYGTSLPTTCRVGQVFWDTDADTDGSLYVCKSANTWKEVDDDGSGGAPTDAKYLVTEANGSLSAEVVVSANAATLLGHDFAAMLTDLGITDEDIQDLIGAMLTGNTETGITVTYQDDDGTIDFEVAFTEAAFTTKIGADYDTAAELAALFSALLEKAGGTMTGTLVFGDGIEINFGAGTDVKVAWNDSTQMLEFLDSSDNVIFAVDPSNYGTLTAAVADPESSGYDSDAVGTARADQYAGGYGVGFILGRKEGYAGTAEDHETSNHIIYYMNLGTKTEGFRVDGLTGIATGTYVGGGLKSYTLTNCEGAQDDGASGGDLLFLTDDGESFGTNTYVGMTLYNVTDGSSCVIGENDDDDMYCTGYVSGSASGLTGGTDNDWDDGDTWAVAPGPQQSGAAFYISGSTTILHPATVGYVAAYFSSSTGTVKVDPQSASMTINFSDDGTYTDPGAGDEIDGDGTQGDFIVIHNASATEAYSWGVNGSWADGGSS